MGDNDVEVLTCLIADIVVDVLASIGDDAEARFRFFKEFVELAKRARSERQLM